MSTYYEPPEYHTSSAEDAWYHRWLPGSTPQFLVPVFLRSILWSRRRAMKGLFTENDMVTASHRTAKYIEKTGGSLHITGIDKLADNSGPFVFCGNHMSTLETFLLPGIITPYMPCSFVVKDALLQNRIFGPIMNALQPIAVGRQDPRKDLKAVLQEGTEHIQKNGRSIFIFPQTTRMTTFNPEQFNSLGVKLASRAGVPVIPVALKTDFWTPGKVLKDVGSVHPEKDVRISFGEPRLCDNNVREIQSQVVEFVQSHLQQWGVKIET